MTQLGPIQQQWVQYLKDNAHLKQEGSLGTVQENGEIRMCCLGAAKKILCDIAGTPLPLTTDKLCGTTVVYDGTVNITGVLNSYEDIGLHNSDGKFRKDYDCCPSLISMNDSLKYTWVEIADYIENNFDNVFTKEV